MTSRTESVSLHVPLGVFDCDDCGVTFEEIRVIVEIENGSPTLNGYGAIVSIGCMGGMSRYGLTKEQALEFVDEASQDPIVKQAKVKNEIALLISSLENL